MTAKRSDAPVPPGRSHLPVPCRMVVDHAIARVPVPAEALGQAAGSGTGAGAMVAPSVRTGQAVSKDRRRSVRYEHRVLEFPPADTEPWQGTFWPPGSIRQLEEELAALGAAGFAVVNTASVGSGRKLTIFLTREVHDDAP